MADDTGDTRTLGQLVAQLNDHMRTLLRYEIALAKAELKTAATKGGLGAGLLAGAGTLAFLALVLALFAGVYGLVAAGLPEWAGFLIVAGVLVLVAGVLAAVGVAKVRAVKGAPRATATTKDTVATLKGGHPVGTAPGGAAAATGRSR